VTGSSLPIIENNPIELRTVSLLPNLFLVEAIRNDLDVFEEICVEDVLAIIRVDYLIKSI